MFKAVKDAIASRAARHWVNTVFERYGRVEHLKIDSHRKTIEVTCHLDGEPLPIVVTIGDYLLESESDRTFFRALSFRCTRPWLQKLLREFGPRQRFEIPRVAALALG